MQLIKKLQYPYLLQFYLFYYFRKSVVDPANPPKDVALTSSVTGAGKVVNGKENNYENLIALLPQKIEDRIVQLSKILEEENAVERLRRGDVSQEERLKYSHIISMIMELEARSMS